MYIFIYIFQKKYIENTCEEIWKELDEKSKQEYGKKYVFQDCENRIEEESKAGNVEKILQTIEKALFNYKPYSTYKVKSAYCQYLDFNCVSTK